MIPYFFLSVSFLSLSVYPVRVHMLPTEVLAWTRYTRLSFLSFSPYLLRQSLWLTLELTKCFVILSSMLGPGIPEAYFHLLDFCVDAGALNVGPRLTQLECYLLSRSPGFTRHFLASPACYQKEGITMIANESFMRQKTLSSLVREWLNSFLG